MREIYYTIEHIPSFRKSWGLYRHVRGINENTCEPMAYFRSEELAILTKKELGK